MFLLYLFAMPYYRFYSELVGDMAVNYEIPIIVAGAVSVFHMKTLIFLIFLNLILYDK